MKQKIIGVILILVGLGYGAFQYFLFESVPLMSGELQLSGLKDKVEVYRDKMGIPHIEAKNELDLYRALGWVHASERLFQLDLYRRASTGELSEIFGEVTLEKDRLSKTLLFDSPYDHPNRAPLEEAAKERIEAYLGGLNSFIERDVLPLEFKILGYKPRAFILRDIYSFVGYMAYLFGNAPRQDPLLQKLKNKNIYDDETLKLLGNDEGDRQKEVFSNFPVNLEPLYQQDALYLAPFTGSNAWVLAPSRSENGAALFANDPHVGISLPGLWFEAHLKAGDFEVYGHFLPLIPFAALGHNRDHAWGMTISYTDDMDFYQEEIDWNSHKVKFQGEFVPLKEHHHKLKIKGGPKDKDFISWSGPHGPLLGKASKEDFSKPEYALQWTYHHKDNRPLQAFYDFNYAKNMDEMRQATTEGTAPGLNIIYADKSGNIAWWMYGAIPIRPRGMDGYSVYPGANGEYEWLGHVANDKKPQIENPTSGIIVSANGRPPGSESSLKGYWQPQDRAQSIFKALSIKEKHSAEQMKGLQGSNFNAQALLYRDHLVRILSASEIEDEPSKSSLELLKNWDGKSEKNSSGALIYHHLTVKLLKNLFDELEEEDFLTYCSVNASWLALYRLSELNEHKIWDLKRTPQLETMRETLVLSFNETIKELSMEYGKDLDSWRWGAHHKIEFRHPLGARGGVLGRIFNLGPFEAPGSYNSINNYRKLGCKEGFSVRAGPSTRRVLDFSHIEESYGGLPLGISGHHKSPYFDIEREDFLNAKHRPQTMNWQKIKSYSLLTLIPRP